MCLKPRAHDSEFSLLTCNHPIIEIIEQKKEFHIFCSHLPFCLLPRSMPLRTPQALGCFDCQRFLSLIAAVVAVSTLHMAVLLSDPFVAPLRHINGCTPGEQRATLGSDPACMAPYTHADTHQNRIRTRPTSAEESVTCELPHLATQMNTAIKNSLPMITTPVPSAVFHAPQLYSALCLHTQHTHAV